MLFLCFSQGSRGSGLLCLNPFQREEWLYRQEHAPVHSFRYLGQGKEVGRQLCKVSSQCQRPVNADAGLSGCQGTGAGHPSVLPSARCWAHWSTQGCAGTRLMPSPAMGSPRYTPSRFLTCQLGSAAAVPSCRAGPGVWPQGGYQSWPPAKVWPHVLAAAIPMRGRYKRTQ